MGREAVLVSLAFFMAVELLAATAASSQENQTVEVVGYTHGVCIAGGEKLRPMWAENRYISRLRVPDGGY